MRRRLSRFTTALATETKMTTENITQVFNGALARHRELFDILEQLLPDFELLTQQISDSLKAGGKVIFMGNGGSAADSQHLAAEFVVRYKAERAPLASIALTVDTSILTAHSNDYSFETVFTRQIQALCRPEDVVVGLSTSGNSANILDAMQAANEIGATTWAWTGETGGRLKSQTNHCLCVPHTETARIQEAHIFIGHCLCEALDVEYQSA